MLSTGALDEASVEAAVLDVESGTVEETVG